MVVEAVEDLDAAAVGELPVGAVGLPQLIGQRSLEADEGRARALVGCGAISPLRLRMRQMVATDGALPSWRRRWWAMVCAAVVAGVGEFPAEANDRG